MASMFGQFKVLDRPKFSDATHKFLIREVKKFTAQSGFTGVTFDLRATDEDDPMFEGEQVKMMMPVFPDLTEDEFNEKTDGQKKWIMSSMDNWQKVMTALGVPEDELDDPDFSSFTGLLITAYGKWKTQQNGQDEWNVYQNTIKIAD